MNFWISILITYIFFVIICFALPFLAKNLFHSNFTLDPNLNKGTWYMFKHFYLKDTLQLLSIGIPVITILMYVLFGIQASFGGLTATWTVFSIIVGMAIYLATKNKPRN